eukprot:TRINITY_DN15769_c0_g1_i1.p1 TRINITY_DN15769_c0_g1~~TRINITY_DN15769_c0_g1_i1.p1  ORF type:complete len:302 (+),score=98.73 TRINITY_DN15769_c0_g1_i1:56-961(+)
MRAAAAVLLSAAGADALKYFGFYSDDLEVTSPFTNLHQAATAADAVKAKAAGQVSLLSVYSTFLTRGSPGLELRSDYEARWAAFAKDATPLLSNSTIIGFNLGDELVWNCLEPSQLVTMSDTVRGTFPRGSAVIWYNEATGPLLSGVDICGKKHSDYRIPASLDWYSIDTYHMDGPVKGWVDAHVRGLYRQHIYPKLGESQQVMLVPGSFGSDVNHYPNGTYVCNRTCYDVMCAEDAGDFYAWAKEDPKVVAVMPWEWKGCPTCNGSRWTPPHTCCMDEIGTVDQPRARHAWTEIGKEIIG